MSPRGPHRPPVSQPGGHVFGPFDSECRRWWTLLVIGELLLVVGPEIHPAPAQTCQVPVTTITRFVNCNSSTNGDGTSGNPWNSLATAAQSIASGTEVRVSGSPCSANNVTIASKSDVKFTAVGTVRVIRSGSGDAFRIHAPATRIEIENFQIVADAGRFNEGVVVAAPTSGTSVNNVTLDGVRVLDATSSAGIAITSPGNNICLVGTRVTGAGTSHNGYRVTVPSSTGTLPGLQFIGALAQDNTSDGFAISNSPATGVVDALFDGSLAIGNDGDGFDVAGGTTVLLNVTSTDNGGLSGQGRGIVTFGSLHIENAHVVRNLGRGINAGNQTARILACTVAENHAGAPPPTPRTEIISEATLFVYNTIASGPNISLQMTGGSATCDYNLFSGASDSCFGAHSIRASPV
jgi:hypothetical protein